eukprot:7795442-Pyramimonas_sp.AAC.1
MAQSMLSCPKRRRGYNISATVCRINRPAVKCERIFTFSHRSSRSEDSTGRGRPETKHITLD